MRQWWSLSILLLKKLWDRMLYSLNTTCPAQLQVGAEMDTRQPSTGAHDVVILGPSSSADSSAALQQDVRSLNAKGTGFFVPLVSCTRRRRRSRRASSKADSWGPSGQGAHAGSPQGPAALGADHPPLMRQDSASSFLPCKPLSAPIALVANCRPLPGPALGAGSAAAAAAALRRRSAQPFQAVAAAAGSSDVISQELLMSMLQLQCDDSTTNRPLVGNVPQQHHQNQSSGYSMPLPPVDNFSGLLQHQPSFDRAEFSTASQTLAFPPNTLQQHAGGFSDRLPHVHADHEMRSLDDRMLERYQQQQSMASAQSSSVHRWSYDEHLLQKAVSLQPPPVLLSPQPRASAARNAAPMVPARQALPTLPPSFEEQLQQQQREAYAQRLQLEQQQQEMEPLDFYPQPQQPCNQLSHAMQMNASQLVPQYQHQQHQQHQTLGMDMYISTFTSSMMVPQQQQQQQQQLSSPEHLRQQQQQQLRPSLDLGPQQVRRQLPPASPATTTAVTGTASYSTLSVMLDAPGMGYNAAPSAAYVSPLLPAGGSQPSFDLQQHEQLLVDSILQNMQLQQQQHEQLAELRELKAQLEQQVQLKQLQPQTMQANAGGGFI